jgi:hypothetical protein
MVAAPSLSKPFVLPHQSAEGCVEPYDPSIPRVSDESMPQEPTSCSNDNPVEPTVFSTDSSDSCISTTTTTIIEQGGEDPVRHLTITDHMLQFLCVETARLFYSYKKCCILQKPFHQLFFAAHEYHSHFVTLREMSKLFPQKACLAKVLLQFPDLNMRSSSRCQNFGFNMVYETRVFSFNEFTHPELDRMCLFHVLNSLEMCELSLSMSKLTLC